MDLISVDRMCSQAIELAKANAKYSHPRKNSKHDQLVKQVMSDAMDENDVEKCCDCCSESLPAPDARLKRVFICSPFRPIGETDGERNRSKKYYRWLVRFACRYAVQAGMIPYAPHLYYTTFLDDADKDEREVGLFLGKLWMMQCDEVWVLGRRISAGMKAEIETAKQWHIPIKYYLPARLPEERLLDAIFFPGIRFNEMALEDSRNLSEYEPYCYPMKKVVVEGGGEADEADEAKDTVDVKGEDDGRE